MKTGQPLVALLVLMSAAGAGSGAAQPPAPGPHLRIAQRARALLPGEVVRLVVRTSEPLAALAGQFEGRPVPFWPGATPDRWIGLVGIDVEIAPGEYRVALRGATVTGIAVESEQALAIAPKAFRQRQLRVDPRFTHPPESVMPRIREEAERLEALFSTTTCVEPPASAFGLPSADRPSSPFGSRSIFNGEPRGRHNGVDFASPRGAPIVAPAHGRVVLADDLYFTGNTVVLEHGCGIYSLFAHLDRTAVELEARVHRGQRLGDVGSTGRSTGPHLHWSVRVQGAKVDPLALVALSAPAR